MTALAVLLRADGRPAAPATGLLPHEAVDGSGPAGPDLLTWADDGVSVAVRGVDATLAVAGDLVVATAGRVPPDALPGCTAGEVAGRLAQAWRRHGADCLKRLPDDVVVAVLERPTRRLTVFRDVGGAVPVYLWADAGEGAAVSTSLPGLVRSSLPLHPDEQWVASYLANAWPGGGRTPYAEVQMLRPGYLASHEPTGWRQDRWDAVALDDDVPADFRCSVDRFRRLFDDAVRRRVQGLAGPAAVTLSGGLDSSSVLVTARAVAPEADLLALCLRFDAPPGDERVHQVAVARAVGARLVWVDPAGSPGPFGSSPATVFAERGGPPLAGNWFLHEGLVDAAVAAGAVRVLDGEDGDGVLGAGAEYLADWAAHEGLRGLLGELAAVRAADGTWPPRLAAAAVREVGRAVGPQWGRAVARRSQHLTTGGYLGSLMGEAYEQWERLPGGISHPFLDRQLLGLALALPGHHRIRGAVTKAVLRAALADRLPPGVLARTDKASLSTPFRDALLGPQWEVLQDGLAAARRSTPDLRDVPIVERGGPAGLTRLYLAYRAAMVAHWREWLTHRNTAAP